MRRASPLPIVVAATLAAGSLLCLAPGSASAAPAMAKAPVPVAPCQAGGVTATDDLIAGQLRPAMNGQRLGSAITGYNVSCARSIVAIVRARGLGQRAAVIAVTAAIAESTLHNYTVAVDHDSLGLFQQRPSQGWGLPGQVVDPYFATQAFLNAMMRKVPAAGWQTGDIGQICQRVQGSAFPLAYAPEVHDAQLLVAALWPQPATPTASPTASPTTTPAKKPTGPFQRSLMKTVTSQGPTSARPDISLADWNADGRPDLVVIQRSGTAGQPTAVNILDATPALAGTASSFQRLLLNTMTALGPTDDRYSFSMADWNGDGHPDLVAIQKSGTASGRTEVRVLDGASMFQNYLQQTVTALGPTDGREDLSVTDWNGDGKPDLVVIQKSGTASGRTEVRVLDGASTFQKNLQQTVTALGPTDDRENFTVTDWNGDGKPDLVAIQETGTASGRAEATILAG